MKSQNLAIYTALFGAYDQLIEPDHKYPNCDFICFTDQKHLKSDIWKIVHCDVDGATGTHKNRNLKMRPHMYLEEYDRSLYVDANVAIIKNPFHICDKLLQNYNFVIPKHFSRKCIYDEAFVLIRSNRIERFKLAKQTLRYLRNGYHSQTEMGENNVLLRNHHLLSKFGEKWWNEFNSGVGRDQFSLAYLSWRLKCPIELRHELSSRTENLFAIKPHQISVRPSLIKRLILHLFIGFPYILIVRIIKFSIKND